MEIPRFDKLDDTEVDQLIDSTPGLRESLNTASALAEEYGSFAPPDTADVDTLISDMFPEN